jgi:CheY-like chemotaxis protein
MLQALVVDDDPVCRAVVSATLAKLGFQVHAAADVEEAHARHATLPDLRVALVDWHLGNERGLAVIKALRQREQAQRICICLHTSEGARDVWNAAIAAGANTVLAKPLSEAGLWSELSRLGAFPPRA